MKNEVINEFKLWLKTQKFNNLSYKKSAAAYIRVSTDKQDEYSPISQLKTIWEYCEKNQMYLNLDYIFIEEEGISGKSTINRSEFQKMIAITKEEKKPFDTLVLWKFSRFARNQEESIVYKSILRKKHNIDVISVSEPLPEGIFGGLIERIIEWFDEYYLINLATEVKRGMTEKATKGGLQASPAFGYNVDKQNNMLVINPTEANIVKLIFYKFVNEKMEMINIAKMLYNMGVKTKRGKRFENRTIYYLLRNPVYIGKLRWTPTGRTKWNFDNPNTIIKQGKHAAIISEELFNEAQAMITRKKIKPRQRKDNNISYWLRGIVRCKECNHTMIKFSKNLLRCNGYNKGACNNHTTLKIEDVENLIINQIKADLSGGTIMNIVCSEKPKKDDNTNEKAVILDRIKLNQSKMLRAKEAYQEGIDTLEEYKKNKMELESEKKSLEKQLMNIAPNKRTLEQKRKMEILENGKEVYEILINKNISTKEKNDILHHLIDRIEFDESLDKLTIFYR